MIYRKMEIKDVDDIFEIEEKSFSTPWSKSAISSELKNKLARHIVAECDGKSVGYVGVWYIIDEAHVTNVAVHPDYRGKKIGDNLIKKLIEICKKDRIMSITLEVRKSNIIAQNLYKKYGFLPGGIRKEYYSDNKEDAIIMWKEMTGGL